MVPSNTSSKAAWQNIQAEMPHDLSAINIPIQPAAPVGAEGVTLVLGKMQIGIVGQDADCTMTRCKPTVGKRRVGDPEIDCVSFRKRRPCRGRFPVAAPPAVPMPASCSKDISHGDCVHCWEAFVSTSCSELPSENSTALSSKSSLLPKKCSTTPDGKALRWGTWGILESSTCPRNVIGCPVSSPSGQ
jgi:hypothetical protein